jgi:hypothetical protein
MQFTPFSSPGIILTYKCSSTCRHCLYACSPHWQEWATAKGLEATFRTLAEAGGVRGLHLAGGEAFFRFPLLLESVRQAVRYGLPIDYVETNGHWFRGDDDATAKLTALRDAGLDCLMVSCSPLHAEFVPLASTLGTLRAARRVFGTQGVFVWLPEFLTQLQGLGVEGTLPFEDYARRAGRAAAREAATYGGQLIPAGRALYALAAYLPRQSVEECCTTSCARRLLTGGHGHYDLYGNILPCAGLSLGEVAELPRLTTDAIFAARPLVRLLCEEGVRGLLAYAVDRYAYQPHDVYAGPCHLCMDIRRHLVAVDAPYPELAPRMMYREASVIEEEHA